MKRGAGYAQGVLLAAKAHGIFPVGYTSARTEGAFIFRHTIVAVGAEKKATPDITAKSICSA